VETFKRLREIRGGYRKMSAGSHVIFYRQNRGGKLMNRGIPADTKKCPEHKTLSCRLNNLAITVAKEGGRHFTKASFPMRFGYYSEIRTPEYEFHFNLNGDIKFIRGLNVSWPHPSESLKRTNGNDWVYYTVGAVINQKHIIDWFGEYYLPCLTYPSNAFWEFNPYADPRISGAFAAWSQLYATLYTIQCDGVPSGIKDFISMVVHKDENALHAQSQKLHGIIGGRVSVLPPDARHVDYEVVPLNIADGCLYHCNFCCVKSKESYQSRSRENVLEQIELLKAFYGRNMENYNALFLGNHDALGAGDELICMAASEAFKALGFENANLKKPMLFLFGSVGSLLKTGNGLMEKLNSLPFYTMINIGLESVHEKTLASINKPLKVSSIREAFNKMLEINRQYTNIEVSANFLLGEQLLPDHTHSLIELLRDVPDDSEKKGTIYLSPLTGSHKKSELLNSFFEIKKLSRLPAYIYLIQRL
jgi:hypothetical protein